MTLELIAMRWLWLEKKCHYVIEQRCTRFWMGNPDVLGVTSSRYMTEIEIKRSLSDFRADGNKRHRMPATRQSMIKEMPRQFYYMVPRHLSEKVLPLLPPWAGLMQPQDNEVQAEVIRPATINRESRRLSIKECVKMTRKMVAHMMTHAESSAIHHSRFEQRDDQSFIGWYDHRNGTYQI